MKGVRTPDTLSVVAREAYWRNNEMCKRESAQSQTRKALTSPIFSAADLAPSVAPSFAAPIV